MRWSDLTQQELVNEAARKAGSVRKLGLKLGIPADSLYRWRKDPHQDGYAGMKFDATIALLAYVGWLDEASQPAPAAPDPGAMAEALDEAASVLERLAVDLRGRADPRANAN